MTSINTGSVGPAIPPKAVSTPAPAPAPSPQPAAASASAKAAPKATPNAAKAPDAPVTNDAAKAVAQSTQVLKDVSETKEKAEQSRQITQKKVDEAVQRLNEQMQHSQRELGFSVDNKTDRLIVKVTNKETGELVRQIPAEAVVKMAQSIESLKGVLFDKEF
jgi:flagellar protein FlaG